MSAATENKDAKSHNPITQLAVQVSGEVISAITKHSKGRNKADKGELETTLKALLKKHFDKLRNDQEKTQLRRKLSLSLHSDKLRNNHQIYDYLESIKAKELPFDCLQNCQTGPSMVSQISLSPTAWIQRVSGHLQRIAAYKAQLENPEPLKQQLLQNRLEFMSRIPETLKQLSREYHVSSDSSRITGETQQKQIVTALLKKNLSDEHRPIVEQIHAALNQSVDEQLQAVLSQARVALDSERAELRHIAPGLVPTLSMSEDLDRYIQPLKFFGNVIIYAVNFALIVAILASLLPSLILTAVRKILGFFINLITGGEYNKRIDAYETSQVPTAFSTAMDAMRQQNPQLAEMSDDELFDAILPSLQELPRIKGGCQSREEFEANLKSGIPISSLAFLKCSFGALWHSLTHMPKGAGWAFLWILTWIPRLALGLVLGIVGTALEAVKAVVSNVLTLGTLLVAFIVRTLTLLALNLPLYILVDLPRALGRLCCGDERKPVEPETEPNPLRTSAMNRPGADQHLDGEDLGSSFSAPLSHQQKGSQHPRGSESTSTERSTSAMSFSAVSSEVD